MTWPRTGSRAASESGPDPGLPWSPSAVSTQQTPFSGLKAFLHERLGFPQCGPLPSMCRGGPGGEAAGWKEGGEQGKGEAGLPEGGGTGRAATLASCGRARPWWLTDTSLLLLGHEGLPLCMATQGSLLWLRARPRSVAFALFQISRIRNWFTICPASGGFFGISAWNVPPRDVLQASSPISHLHGPVLTPPP